MDTLGKDEISGNEGENETGEIFWPPAAYNELHIHNTRFVMEQISSLTCLKSLLITF